MSIWTILFLILLIAWIGGFTVFHAAGGLIHLLLVFAVISDPAFRFGNSKHSLMFVFGWVSKFVVSRRVVFQSVEI